MDSLGDKIEMIENDLRNGNTDTATQAVWQKNTGQVFLHEMMHLDVIGQPHSKPELIMRRSRLRSRALTNVKVNDESVEPEAGQHFAYGPKRVHQLARLAKRDGGGATRASTNADSYAWLANSKFFWDLTGYFPAPDNYKGHEQNLPADMGNMELEGFTIDFGKIDENTTEAELKDRLNKILAGYGNNTDSIPSNDKPSKGKSLSIAMVTQVNSHGGGASYDAQWHFYATAVGHEVSCDPSSDNQVSEIANKGPSDAKFNFGGDQRNLPWPAGTYNLSIDGEDCQYRNDGTNPGRLFCPKKEISCTEDSKKNTDQGLPGCSSTRVKFHPAVYCDF
jgi:hypothetical protein